jgi:hypothetical protein
MATTAQSLLALYGALDQAVTSTGDPAIEAVVERYLPGSTGVNAGWYDQLLGFLADPAYQRRGRRPPAVPDLDEALTTLQTHRTRADENPAELLSSLQMSRMTYAIGALSHLPSVYQPSTWSEPFSTTLGLVAPVQEVQVAWISDSSADEDFSDEDGPSDGGGPSDGDLLELLRRRLRRRDDWPELARDAVEKGLISKDVADVPQCQVKAKWVRGHLCVVLNTEFNSKKVSLDQLKSVVDPLNWHLCLPFFCKMTRHATRHDGWSRVLEQVSVTCPFAGTHMATPLKYWKGPSVGEVLSEPSAWLDYALDDDPVAGATGDGRMVVDEGFITMTSTSGDAAVAGVRVCTRKVAGFRNLGFVPASIFACVMGYGDQGVEMLLGGVDKRPAPGGRGPGSKSDWEDWKPSTRNPAGSDPAKATPAPSDTPQADPTPPQQPVPDPDDPSRRAVVLAVDMLNDYITDMSKKSEVIAAKWASGVVPIAESINYGADVAARLATDPWRFLQRLRDSDQGGDK